MGLAEKKARRANLLEQWPFCHWCGREVREYPAGDTAMHADRATIDHLIQRSEMRPRPRRGSIVLSCSPCNHRRGAEGEAARIEREGAHLEQSICIECAILFSGRRKFFCSGGHWEANLRRLGKWNPGEEECLRGRLP